MNEEPKRPPGSLIKRAFLNQYNYILLGATALYSLTTGSWVPAVVGVGAEVLWLVVGADSRGFRRWVARKESAEEQQRALAETAALLAGLEPPYVETFEALRRTGDEIHALAGDNVGLETSLLQDEMAKLGALLHSFLRMAVAHQRLARHLRANPSGEIEHDIARAERALRTEEDRRVQASLKQALSLAQKRWKQQHEIEGAWKALSVRMETLEKSFEYLKSHILGIGTHGELAAELDGLVAGVASVAELEETTDALMDDLRAGAARRTTRLERT